jgi:hypothetical protein
MSKRDGMFDILQTTLEFIVFVSLGDKKMTMNFPFFTCPWLAIYLRNGRQHSLPNPPKSENTGH